MDREPHFPKGFGVFFLYKVRFIRYLDYNTAKAFYER